MIITRRNPERNLPKFDCDRCSMRNFKTKEELEQHKREKHMKHGIECPCEECKKIRNILRNPDITLIATEEDKRKLMEMDK